MQHFFHFVITFGWVQQQNKSKPTQKWWRNEKKWVTGQSCIHKEVTSYKIHTLRASISKVNCDSKSNLLLLTQQLTAAHKCVDMVPEQCSAPLLNFDQYLSTSFMNLIPVQNFYGLIQIILDWNKSIKRQNSVRQCF